MNLFRETQKLHPKGGVFGMLWYTNIHVFTIQKTEQK